MQPTLVFSATHAGLIYLNGRLAGEVSETEVLIRPVGAWGVLYLEFHPFSSACASMARRLVFSSGQPMPESVEAAEQLRAVCWPGGIIEIELSPTVSEQDEAQNFEVSGHRLSISAEHPPRLIEDTLVLGALPEGAQIPKLYSLQNGIALIGACAEGQYLFTLDPAISRQTGFLRAQELRPLDSGRIEAILRETDLLGHARRERWRLTRDGLEMEASESYRPSRLPQTPEETARAALEALLDGRYEEAERLLSPALKTRLPFEHLREKYDLCVEMKYCVPDARSCVGLLYLIGDQLAKVDPLYYSYSATQDADHPYQIEALDESELSLGDSSE